jgi:hypothetical protein
MDRWTWCNWLRYEDTESPENLNGQVKHLIALKMLKCELQ